MTILTPRRLGSVPARADDGWRGWAALAAVVVLGILGMHAIGLHGSQHANPGVMTSSSAMPAMGTHPDAADSRRQGDPEAGSRGDPTDLLRPADLGHGMGGMAMLCIAVLVGAALARMIMRSHRGVGLSLRDPVLTSMHVVGIAEVRQTGPPPVWAFSVIRC